MKTANHTSSGKHTNLSNRHKILFAKAKVALLCTIALFATLLSAQTLPALTLSGQVQSAVSQNPVDFATVIVIEARKKAYTDDQGRFSLTIPEPGTYTIRITSPGLATYQKKLELTDDSERTFALQPTEVKGRTLVVRSERNIQKVSRHTMTVKQLKETPATLGDPLNALTTLPGINRTASLFGQVVIRAMTGTYGTSNWFEIDGMPMQYPQHFGGVHSVISLDLIREIDLYASAFPAPFGNSYSAVVNFNTIDEIKEFGGHASINILSTNFESHIPLDDQGGYALVAGRAGYLSLLVPAITRAMGNEVTQLPDYYDYQFKIKKYLGSKGHHSVHALFLGAKDKWKFVANEEDAQDGDEYQDPFNFAWNLQISNGFDNLGTYYTYDPSDKLYFRQLVYFSFNRYQGEFDNKYLPPDINNLANISDQNIYGSKNWFRFQWLDSAELHLGTDVSLYNFHSDINNILPAGNATSPDIYQEGDFKRYVSRTKLWNTGLAAFIENRFTWQGWKFVPGLRTEWLHINTDSTRGDGTKIQGTSSMDPTFSPRGVLSYTFPTETTVAIAGGIYYAYVQSSIFWMQAAPEISEAYYVKPEKSVHRVVSLEQKWRLVTITIEGFYNNMKNMVVPDQRNPYETEPKYGEPIRVRNSGQGENYGFEIMARLDREQNQSTGLFGWLSYTYTDARFNRGLPQLSLTQTELVNAGLISPTATAEDVADYNAADNDWYRNNYEMRHSVKFIGGYFWGSHSVSVRYEFATSTPYTPIVGNSDPTTYEVDGETRQRYAPIYGERNSKRYEPSHRIDLRYAYSPTYSWGQLSFYAEIILITNQREIERWKYDQPYDPEDNPVMAVSDNRIPFIPLLGLEAKF